MLSDKNCFFCLRNVNCQEPWNLSQKAQKAQNRKTGIVNELFEIGKLMAIDVIL